MYALKKAQSTEIFTLATVPGGFSGYITGINAEDRPGLSARELESRFIELGFVEGAKIQILHQGGLRKDPIAVRVNNNTVALRRSIAASILVE
jgi:ferrous iron transport protein A